MLNITERGRWRVFNGKNPLKMMLYLDLLCFLGHNSCFFSSKIKSKPQKITLWLSILKISFFCDFGCPYAYRGVPYVYGSVWGSKNVNWGISCAYGAYGGMSYAYGGRPYMYGLKHIFFRSDTRMGIKFQISLLCLHKSCHLMLAFICY